MEFNVTAIRNAAKLITFAANIGMDLDRIGEIAYHTESKKTFMRHDDYKFELRISDSSNDIVASWYYGGVEWTKVCTEDTTLDGIDGLIEWSEK